MVRYGAKEGVADKIRLLYGERDRTAQTATGLPSQYITLSLSRSWLFALLHFIRMEKEAERVTGEGYDYIRYVLSLKDERGSDLDQTFFEVLLASADEERHFLVVILYARHNRSFPRYYLKSAYNAPEVCKKDCALRPHIQVCPQEYIVDQG